MRNALILLFLAATAASAQTLTRRFVVPSAARTASGVFDIFPMVGTADRATCLLDVTAQSGTTPTLDVYIQGSPDASGTFDDVAHFAQVGAATGKQVAQLSFDVAASATPVHAPADGTMAASTVRNGPFGDRLRVKWTLGGSSPSYTFSVTCFVTG